MASEDRDSVDVGHIPGVGEVIQDRYRLDSTVATGGMGVIMKATQLAMERDVAIKLLHPHMASDSKTVARFEREVHLAKHLSHPHTIQLFDFGKTDGGSLYIVMEYLEGRDLKEILNDEGGLTLGRTVEIGLQSLDGLAEAHEHDVVHRDLKPSNIFIQEDRRGGDFVKLLDFGIAKSLEGGGAALTATGQVCGTPQYMAPEAVLKRAAGKPGDVYAMGLILMEMMVGRRLFDAGSMPQTIMLQMNQPVPIPDRLAETPFCEVIERSTAKHPDDRYQDADEMFEALDRVAGEIPEDLTLLPQEIPNVSAPDSSDMLDQLPREIDDSDIEMLDRRDADESSEVIPDAEAGTGGSQPGVRPPEPEARSHPRPDGPPPQPSAESPAAQSAEQTPPDADTVITPAPDQSSEAPSAPDEPTIQTTETPDFEEADPEETIDEPGAAPAHTPAPQNDAAGLGTWQLPEPLAEQLEAIGLDPDDERLLAVGAGGLVVVTLFFGLLLWPGGGDSSATASNTDEPSGETAAEQDPAEATPTEGGSAGGSDETAAGDETPADDPEAAPATADAGGDREPDTSTQAAPAGDAADSSDTKSAPETVTIRIDSHPSRAAIFLDGERLGLTPQKFEMEREGREREFRLVRRGYYPKDVTVDPTEETDYRIALRGRAPSGAAADDESTGASASPTSGRSSDDENDEETNREIENILDKHSLD